MGGVDTPSISLTMNFLSVRIRYWFKLAMAAGDDFYSYEAKYIDEKGARLDYPAKLSPEIEQAIQAVAVKTFRVLCCEGMARIDFFLTPQNNIVVNEINTLPGFTQISMYPKLWEVSGLSYTKLLDELIELAFERYNREKELETSVEF